MGQPLWLSLRPNPVPMLHLRPGTDITMVVGQDIMEDTGDTMDGADTTDTPTDTDTVTWENVPLMPNPKLLMPLPGIMVVLWTPLQIRILRFGIPWTLRTSL